MHKKHNYKKRLAQIYALAGIHAHYIEEDYQKAVKYLTKSIQIAEETNNFISLIFSNHFLGHVFVDNCEFEKGHHHIKKALEIVEMGNVLWSIALHKACIAFNVFGAQGKIDLAYQTGKEAVLLADKSGDILSKTEAYTNYGYCCLFKGNIKEAESYLVMGRNFSKKANTTTYEYLANMYLGEMYFLSQEYRKAQEYFANAVTIDKNWTIGQSTINLRRLPLAAAKIMNNEKDIDLRLLNSYIAQNKFKRYDGRMRRYFSIILLNIDDEHVSKAQESIEQAIEMDQVTRYNFELGMDYKVYADVYKKTGNVAKAREMIGHAIEIFDECGADGWVQRTEQDLISIQ